MSAEHADRLAALPENWDGYHARPVSEAALKVARHLAVVPTTNGGIQIEWHCNGWDVEISVSATGEPDGVYFERTTAAAPSEPTP